MVPGKRPRRSSLAVRSPNRSGYRRRSELTSNATCKRRSRVLANRLLEDESSKEVVQEEAGPRTGTEWPREARGLGRLAVLTRSSELGATQFLHGLSSASAHILTRSPLWTQNASVLEGPRVMDRSPKRGGEKRSRDIDTRWDERSRSVCDQFNDQR